MQQIGYVLPVSGDAAKEDAIGTQVDWVHCELAYFHLLLKEIISLSGPPFSRRLNN